MSANLFEFQKWTDDGFVFGQRWCYKRVENFTRTERKRTNKRSEGNVSRLIIFLREIKRKMLKKKDKNSVSILFIFSFLAKNYFFQF